MKNDDTKLKEAFLAYHAIQIKLDNGIPFSIKKGKKILQVLVTNSWVEQSRNGYEINFDDTSAIADCELSKWLESEFGLYVSDIFHGCFVVDDFKKSPLGKEFEKELKNFHTVFPANDKKSDLFLNAYWDAKRASGKNIKVESLYKKFIEIYEESLKILIEREIRAKKQKEVLTNPEEFLSINGVLISKEEIKRLAKSL